jgi:hypothetical protein
MPAASQQQGASTYSYRFAPAALARRIAVPVGARAKAKFSKSVAPDPARSKATGGGAWT